jgi:hypothetical protein
VVDLYSLLLALAIGTAVAAVSLGAAMRWTSRAEHVRPLGRGARMASIAALGFGAASAAWHVTTGHRPGTADALGAVDFILAHRALPIVAALAVGGLALARDRR